jgi:hypothetical protein
MAKVLAAVPVATNQMLADSPKILRKPATAADVYSSSP